MNENVKISVVIATYNRAGDIKDILEGMLGQDTKGEFDFEVIVVDNNSSDDTGRVVESFSLRFNGRLTYLFEPRQGKPYALNRGVAAARGEIVSFVDDDCLIEPVYLWNVAAAFRKFGQEAGLIGGKIAPHWTGGECPGWLKALFSQPSRFEDGTFNREKIGFEGTLGIFDLGNEPIVLDYSQEGHPNYQFFGANMAIFRHHLTGNDAFNVAKFYSQDTDICLRLFNRGIKGVYVPSVQLKHKIPVSKATPGKFYRWWYLRGRYSGPKPGQSRELVSKIIDCLGKSLREKQYLTKIHLRYRAFYYFGQLREIIAGQCPFFRKVRDFMQRQKSIKTIDLEKSYESCFEPSHSIDDIEQARTDKALRNLLKDSVYVAFLKKLVERGEVSDDEIAETQYFKEAWDCVGKYGSYQGRIKDKAALAEYCREFLRLYDTLKKRVCVNPPAKLINAVIDHYRYGYPDVFLIKNSKATMVYDGAHRMASYYVLGERGIRANVKGIIAGPIKIVETRNGPWQRAKTENRGSSSDE